MFAWACNKLRLLMPVEFIPNSNKNGLIINTPPDRLPTIKFFFKFFTEKPNILVLCKYKKSKIITKKYKISVYPYIQGFV